MTIAMCVCLFLGTPPLHPQELCHFIHQYPLTLGDRKRDLDLDTQHQGDSYFSDKRFFPESDSLAPLYLEFDVERN